MRILHCIYSKKLQFGTDDQRQIYTLDSAGYTIQTETDVTNDGSIDKVSTYTLNEKGKILQKLDYNRSYDTQGVATDTLVQKEVYNVDSNGYTVGMTRYMGSNTQPIVVETYELNALGQSTKALIDNYGDNVIDRAEIYTRDEHGRISKTEIDVGNTGEVDSNITYIRDALGRVTEQYSDAKNDGTNVTKTSSVRDVYGNVLESKTDNGNDGILDGVTYNTYNANNIRISYWVDSPVNGTQDATDYSESYELNAQNLPSVKHINNGRTQYDLYLQYDDNNQVSYQRFDYNRDGIMNNNDVYETLKYDAVWLKVSEITRYNQDDTITVIANYEYNSTGALVRYFYDNKGDGTIESLAFGNYRGGGTVNHSEDMTTWTTSQLSRFNNGLADIVLSDQAAATNLTLNAEVVSKIVSSTKILNIAGDATDTVNLTNFQASTSDKSGYNKYLATVDSTAYTLYIDSDVQTVLS